MCADDCCLSRFVCLSRRIVLDLSWPVLFRHTPHHVCVRLFAAKYAANAARVFSAGSRAQSGALCEEKLGRQAAKTGCGAGCGGAPWWMGQGARSLEQNDVLSSRRRRTGRCGDVGVHLAPSRIAVYALRRLPV